jgi:serine/threonine protein phosphatase PrpC
MSRDSEDTSPLPIAVSPDKRLAAGASALVQVDVAGMSDPGRVRRGNEDHFVALRFERSMKTLLSNLPEGEVPPTYGETAYGYLVADGVGGNAAGEVASRTAIHALIGLAMETPDWNMRLDAHVADEVLRRMEERFRKVREILVERSKENPSLSGMATTLTAACTIGPEVLTAHVGDSRAYIARKGGGVEKLTRDQTMAQSLADSGAIAQEDVARSPYRNVLTSALGTKGMFVQVELGRARLEDGDALLLCSDGLTEMVPEDRIAQVLREARSSDDACRRLVDYALEAGGSDNVTVIVARYRIPSAAERLEETGG